MSLWDGIKSLFSAGAATVVDSIGGAIDKLSTTDEEKLTLKNELAKLMNDFELSLEDKANEFEKEITERHANDMQSDNKMSKNIRPAVLGYLIVFVSLLAAATIFFLDKDDVVLVNAWIPLFTALLITVVGFYFGSRGGEKITDMITKLKGKNNG